MKRPRLRKRAVGLALLLVVLLSLAGTFAFLLYRPLPAIDGDYRLLGLEERAEIVRDDYGVPHIFARTAHDVFFLQGYATAQDRLFQLDLFRRSGRGRLSEILGDAGLETDKFVRTIGLARAAELDAALLSDPARRALDAYADGVNKYLEQRGDALPLEFVLLGYKPDPWTAVDSLVVLKLEAFDLATNYGTELARANVAARAGPSALAQLFPDSDLRPPTGLDDGSWAAVREAFGSPAAVPGLAGLRALLGEAGTVS